MKSTTGGPGRTKSAEVRYCSSHCDTYQSPGFETCRHQAWWVGCSDIWHSELSFRLSLLSCRSQAGYSLQLV